MNRNTFYILGMFCLSMAYCKSPMPVTFNPDDHTNANGTAGSAKMTYQMPPKNNNVVIRSDTIKLPHDTARVKQ